MEDSSVLSEMKLDHFKKELNRRVASKRHLYEIIYQKYYLPELNSKAVTIEYLTQYVDANSNVFKMPWERVVLAKARKRAKTKEELFDILQFEVSEKNFGNWALISFDFQTKSG